ncbi:MAG: protein kinase [Phycisphaerales bacterium JB039]
MNPAVDIFGKAVQLRGEARVAYLDEACGADAALRVEIDSLLEAHDAAGTFLGEPGRAMEDALRQPSGVGQPAGESAGDMIDRYRLVEQIGEGGFGVVWMAEQTEPIRRRVAMKIIKLGMDTEQVIARFESERQALATLDHPNIARVLDAGATQAGRPFFVMELIRGEPIVEYCAGRQLNMRERLELFVKVCRAIEHAHRHGIIHRDIKPSNVLVTEQDGAAVPKVIDFGVAKATGQELTQRTHFTQHRQMIGTPAYMSPEQAAVSELEIDARSDIYSLGVLLYELLTGTAPFASEELLARGYAEMMRIIREIDPPKPSTRLASADLPQGEADQPQSDLRELKSALRGDLDWIVMKCLEKDRQRRYETADDLGVDIQRHLSGQAVIAAPPSFGYRVRKAIRRNRRSVTIASLLGLALALSVVVGWQMINAGRLRALAAAPAALRSPWSVTILHPPFAAQSQATGVFGGQQVGFVVIDGVQRAGLWSGTVESWVDLHPEGASSSGPLRNSAALQVGSATIGGVLRAGRWAGSAASWLALHPEGAAESLARAIGNGQVAGQADGRAGLWDDDGAWVDLSPPGATRGQVNDTDGVRQVGEVMIDGVRRASLWRGTADSWVDLHPAGAEHSLIRSMDADQQAGAVTVGGRGHAAVWNGTAESWVDLHPAGATTSSAAAVHGGVQAGSARYGGGGVYHAGVWTGSAESWEDLSLALPGSWWHSYGLDVWTDETTIYVVGYGWNDATSRREALLWMRPIAGAGSASAAAGQPRD